MCDFAHELVCAFALACVCLNLRARVCAFAHARVCVNLRALVQLSARVCMCVCAIYSLSGVTSQIPDNRVKYENIPKLG